MDDLTLLNDLGDIISECDDVDIEFFLKYRSSVVKILDMNELIQNVKDWVKSSTRIQFFSPSAELLVIPNNMKLDLHILDKPIDLSLEDATTIIYDEIGMKLTSYVELKAAELIQETSMSESQLKEIVDYSLFSAVSISMITNKARNRAIATLVF